MSEFARKPAESSHALHAVSGSSAGPAIELAREKHYSIIEIAELWALSEKTVRKIFEREPGVIHWSTEEKLHGRGYRTLRCLRPFFTAFIESYAEQARDQLPGRRREQSSSGAFRALWQFAFSRLVACIKYSPRLSDVERKLLLPRLDPWVRSASL
jgi:hypothetical protein